MSKSLRAILIGTCLFFSQQGFSQYRISGYIEDQSSREKLFGATVIIRGTALGTTSNFYGYFSLPVAQPSLDLVISFVGYQSSVIHFDLKGDTSIVVPLTTSQ